MGEWYGTLGDFKVKTGQIKSKKKNKMKTHEARNILSTLMSPIYIRNFRLHGIGLQVRHMTG